jgi:tripeptidyl-peptidase-1
MRYSFIGAVLGAFAVQALALPSPAYVSHVIHEKRDAVQRRWVRGNAVDPDHVLPVRIGLKQSNLENGMDYLLEVYVSYSTLSLH